jgi:hypothetical protein
MRFLRRFGAPLAASLLLVLSGLPASARLLVEIDKSSQRMVVSQDGVRIHVWPVSTGLRRYDTPSGSYTPFRMEKDHFSREWDDAPMPHSIFFTARGHAIHGTDHARNLGRAASHGCVRLSRPNAATLFALVKQEGMANVRVVLSGEVPAANDPAVARRAPDYRDQPGYVGQNYPGQNYPSQGYASPGYDEPAPRGYRGTAREVRSAPRSGYWMQQPDGSRVFYDRERVPPPSPYFMPRPPGW